jgi:hypothetical protein
MIWVESDPLSRLKTGGIVASKILYLLGGVFWRLGLL